MSEIDIDAFPAREIDPPEYRERPDPLSAAVAEEAIFHDAIAAVPEPVHQERRRNVTPPPIPLLIVWPSRTGGRGHVVTFAADGTSPACICEAAVNGNRCWAIRTAIEIISSRVVTFALPDQR